MYVLINILRMCLHELNLDGRDTVLYIWGPEFEPLTLHFLL